MGCELPLQLRVPPSPHAARPDILHPLLENAVPTLTGRVLPSSLLPLLSLCPAPTLERGGGRRREGEICEKRGRPSGVGQGKRGGEEDNTLLSRQELCRTLAGNVCPVLTITEFGGEGREEEREEVRRRKGVVITGRVHPGESNSSWMMEGLVRFLTSSSPHAKVPLMLAS